MAYRPGMFDDLIPQQGQGARPARAGMFDDLIPQGGQTEEKPSFWQRQRDIVTGELRTEFPDAPEFLPAFLRTAGAATPEARTALMAINQSAVTPDERAQLDILRKNIQGLEEKRDRHGNLMLRAPGMTEFAYLNKPGASGRDLDEVLTQVGATMGIFSPVGLGRSLLARMGIAGAAGVGASAAQDVLAEQAGSEQGVSAARAGVSGAVSAALAPGVPSSVVGGVADLTRAATQPVASFVRGVVNPEREAARRVGTALTRDQQAGLAALTPADEAFAAATGQPLMVADFGGATTRALARSAANTSPEARGVLERAIDRRFETQADRAGEFLTRLVGPPADAAAISQAMTRTAREAVTPAYERALASGRQGIWHPDFDELAKAKPFQDAMKAAEQAMATKEAAGTVQTAATGSWGAPTLEYWDQVKRVLDDRISSLRQAGNREAARDIAALRSRLLATLDQTFPEYAAARRTAAGFFQAEDALEAGEKFAMQRYDLAEAKRAVESMTPNERAMFRQGFASRMLERLNNVADRRSIGAQVAGSNAARQKLEIALGPEAAREMEAFMRVEGVMDLMRGAMQNSTTARQLVELGIAGGVGLYMGGGNPTDPSTWFTAGLILGARRAGVRIDERVVRKVAEMLVSQDPAVRQQAIKQVAHTPQMLRALRSWDEAFVGAPRGAAAMQLVPDGEDR
ncbi:MAG TPA: hypothetical protein VNK52_16050 [Hyphomicrobiaceae bacterium]|nr:hypothetical protein [Hyphomicrobiaceae bacterium]